MIESEVKNFLARKKKLIPKPKLICKIKKLKIKKVFENNLLFIEV